MGTTLLWILQLAFALLMFAAALAWGRRRSSSLRRSAVALALLPLLALHGLLAWKALALRFDVGVLHAPWVAATALLGLHLIGAALLWLRDRRGTGPGSWSAGPLLLCALVALALDLSTLWNLELRARLRASSLRLEAGRIAWRESPPRPADHANAAPIHLRASQVFDGREPVELVAWRPALRDMAVLDTVDPALRSTLAGLADELASTREAARLSACWFEPKPGEPRLGDVEDMVSVPPIAPLLALGDALALEARVRAADGDGAGALEDVDALFALATHLAQTPVLITTLGAVAIRDVGVTTLAHVLSEDSLEQAELEHFELRGDRSLAALVPRALAMEEAYGLSMLGLVAQGDTALTDLGDWKLPERLDVELYNVFLLDADVAGYRETMGELQARAREPLAEFLEAPSIDQAQVRSRGVLATLFVPNLRSTLLAMHRSDARLELARLALAAARYRSRTGRYPTSLTELPASSQAVDLEGDGSFVRLVRTGLEEGEEALELRLPAQMH